MKLFKLFLFALALSFVAPQAIDARPTPKASKNVVHNVGPKKKKSSSRKRSKCDCEACECIYQGRAVYCKLCRRTHIRCKQCFYPRGYYCYCDGACSCYERFD